MSFLWDPSIAGSSLIHYATMLAPKSLTGAIRHFNSLQNKGQLYEEMDGLSLRVPTKQIFFLHTLDNQCAIHT